MKSSDQFEVGDIYGAAYTAAQQAFQRVNIPHHLRHLFIDDAKQEAAESILRCGEKSVSYAFTAARRQVAQWVFEFLRGDKSHRSGNCIRVEHVALDNMLAIGGNPESILIQKERVSEFEDILDEIADILLAIMKASRKQKTGRALNAAVRDTNIILLSLQGYNDKGIAHELGDTPENIRIYLRKARLAIENYLVSII